jgi:hypothetical protein
MFWFGKRKNKEENVKKDIIEDTEENEDIDELVELDESDELEDLEDVEKVYGSDDDEDEPEGEEGGQPIYPDLPEVSKAITSLDMLAEFVTTKATGEMQFLNKETCEAFALREAHLRIAKVWGSVSMAVEYPPQEFARIMLALEVIGEGEKFLVIPSLTEDEGKQAIIDFCEEKYSINGKKYASNVAKFAKLVGENGDMDEWLAYNKELVYDKLVEFCDDNGITFDRSEEGSENE